MGWFFLASILLLSLCGKHQERRLVPRVRTRITRMRDLDGERVGYCPKYVIILQIRYLISSFRRERSSGGFLSFEI
jgi:hypothetical protein